MIRLPLAAGLALAVLFVAIAAFVIYRGVKQTIEDLDHFN